MSQDEKREKERHPASSLSLSDVEERRSLSSSPCFHYVPFKQAPSPQQAHSNPQSSFYCVKSTASSSFLPSTAAVSRPANPRTIFTVIAPIPQGTAARPNVREQLAYRSFFSVASSSTTFFLIGQSRETRRIDETNHDDSNISDACEKIHHHRTSFAFAVGGGAEEEGPRVEG